MLHAEKYSNKLTQVDCWSILSKATPRLPKKQVIFTQWQLLSDVLPVSLKIN